LETAILSFLDFEYVIRSPSLLDNEQGNINAANTLKKFFNETNVSLSRTREWVDDDLNIVNYSKTSAIITSDAHIVSSIVCCKHKKSRNADKKSTVIKEKRASESKKSQNNLLHSKERTKIANKQNSKTSTTRLVKKTMKKKSSYNILIKTFSRNLSNASFNTKLTGSKKNLKRHSLRGSPSRPVS
jgi:hypothetical protein